MDLRTALGFGPGDLAAFTGGGGKTGLAIRLALDTASIFTTTTRILPPDEMPVLVLAEGARLEDAPPGAICIAASRTPEGKLLGLNLEQVEEVRRFALGRGFAGRPALPGALLVESDGSAGLPLKAPAPHEPVIPPSATMVVPVAGGSAFGRPIGAMHRPEYLSAATGGGIEAPVDAAVMNAGLRGCTRGTPPAARVVAVINQCDLLLDLAPARAALAGFDRGVLVAHKQAVGLCGDVAAVVLAGGQGSRFGGGKQRAPYRGTTLLEASLRAPLQAGVREVMVVTGATPLADLLAPYPVRTVHNQDWPEGMASSIRAAVAALSEDVQAVLFSLSDTPRIPPELLRRLIAAWRGGAKIAASNVGGVLRSPVIFDRSVWPELLELAGDEGGRSILRRHGSAVATVTWDDQTVFRDVDVPADMEGL